MPFNVNHIEKGPTNGEAVIFLHGIGGDCHSWDFQLESFSDEYRAIAWDMPGYGSSTSINPMTFENLSNSLFRLMDYLKGQLVGMTSNSACSGDPASGIRDMQVLLRCRVAAKEFTLLMKDDYSIITDISPLSSIIIIEKIKADVQ